MKEGITSDDLPPIPEKLYFSIGEVSSLCAVQAHVLRYWEQEFDSLSPLKRRGNRRYYQRKDIIHIREIRTFLYDRGFTIEGARRQITSKSSSLVELKNKIDSELSEVESIVNQLSELHQEVE